MRFQPIFISILFFTTFMKALIRKVKKMSCSFMVGLTIPVGKASVTESAAVRFYQ
jgi:hypothetical protein